MVRCAALSKTGLTGNMLTTQNSNNDSWCLAQVIHTSEGNGTEEMICEKGRVLDVDLKELTKRMKSCLGIIAEETISSK